MKGSNPKDRIDLVVDVPLYQRASDPMTTTSPTSRAGIATSATGHRLIPASTRPDGSVRKEIRVRPGYRPPEDVEVYKNRTALAGRTRGATGVPGAVAVENGKQRDTPSKNTKRREARKKAAASGASQGQGSREGVTVESAVNGTCDEGLLGEEDAADAHLVVNAHVIDAEAEKEKHVKKLTKRLRQARELKAKKEDGDSLLPEQFEKVIRINEIVRQLDALGFGPDGEEKK